MVAGESRGHGRALSRPGRPLGKAERRAAYATAWYTCPRCHAPPGEACLEAGDILIALGQRRQLDELDKLASG